MKVLSISLFFAVIVLTGFRPYDQDEHIEFTCFKMHKASNACHFNFTVDGQKFRYVDIGCKYQKKREEAIKKVKEGTLALAKDWKIECHIPKDQKEPAGF